ncbi:superoxide dismutase family protein [Xanthomarina sp. F2636L]|uniref:superoxide dismutase family protein n=1 Tax=Xanthomarina sp. F2636L TaxID=2996018 RepID=UPI00225E3885|nr:superoxide dismutase family protein [Xanthomarina sp. F2636L]MCX7550128.1 superoxide dismutase family protein [Xanthomarina sp. F2636L]
MKKIHLIVFALLLSIPLVTGCKNKEKSTETDVPTMEEKTVETVEEEIKKIKIKLEPKSDSNVNGNAIFTETEGKVTMVAVFDGLTPGTHAIHLHEKSDCSSPDGTSTGGHWNPTNQPHGKWGDAKGYHKGDIGNFEADENGNGTISFSTDQWCIGCGDATKDIIGKAVIVHQGVDDFVSQPTGDAGGRVSCGGVLNLE